MPTPPPAPTPTPAPAPDPAFKQVGSWLVRFHDVEYGKSANRNVVVTATVRNNSEQSRTFDQRIGYSLLNGRDNFRREPAQVIIPTGYSASMPPGGSLRLKFVYDVGSVEQQNGINSWTFIERVQMPGSPDRYTQLASQEFALPLLNEPASPAPAPAPAPSTGNGSFLGGADAYLQLRLDTLRRTERGFAVNLTARNEADQRRGLQYNENKVSIVGANGVEYGTDGNYYGRSVSEMLNATVWLEKGQETPITYVFPGLPSNVAPARLLVRSGSNVVAEFNLGQGGSTDTQTNQVGSWSVRLLNSRFDGVSGAAVIHAALRNATSTVQSLRNSHYLGVITARDGTCRTPDSVSYSINNTATDAAAVPPGQILDALFYYHFSPSRGADFTRWTFSEQPQTGPTSCVGIRKQDFPIVLVTSASASASASTPAPVPSPAPEPVPPPAPAPAPTAAAAFQGGTDAYFQLRMDSVGRAGPGVAVTFTARNDADQRRGLQYNENRLSLMGSDGVEYRTDGNYYGRSASELLNATVWLEQGQQAPITYLFPMPSGVTPVRVRLRGPGQAVIAEFNVPAN